MTYLYLLGLKLNHTGLALYSRLLARRVAVVAGQSTRMSSEQVLNALISAEVAQKMRGTSRGSGRSAPGETGVVEQG